MTSLHELLRRLRSATPTRTQRRYRPRLETLEGRDCPALAAPTGLNLTAIAPTQVKVDWNDTTGETGYHILFWDGSKITQLADLPADTTTFTVGGLIPNAQQWLTVEAYTASETAMAAWASVYTPRAPLAAPGGLQAQGISPTQIRLTWSPAPGATSYRILKWDSNGVSEVVQLGAGATTFTVGGLQPNHGYYFQVEARSPSNATSSGWVLGLTSAEEIGTLRGLSARSAGANSVDLRWRAVEGATGYRVWVWNGKRLALLATLDADTTRFRVNRLRSGMRFSFYVQAINGSNSAGAYVKGTPGMIAAPSGVRAIALPGGAIQIRWNSVRQAQGYRVYEQVGKRWILVGGTRPKTTRYLVQHPGAGSRHSFYVQAFAARGRVTANSKVIFVTLTTTSGDSPLTAGNSTKTLII